MLPFNIIEPTAAQVPIIISSPHSGTEIPDEIASRLKPDLLVARDDADWYIDWLYDFAPALGITMITAKYHRWVIDLNRDPDSQPLYDDGRVITELVPTTNFNGEELYVGETPDQQEIAHRLETYYRPYHQQVSELLATTKAKFGKVLLFDAHSIRRVVPGIRPEPFPDLILGDNEGSSASNAIIETAIGALQTGEYDLQHNHPFKGGYITRSFGKPEEQVHALQLEMSKTNYMDKDQICYDELQAKPIRNLLRQLFRELIVELAK